MARQISSIMLLTVLLFAGPVSFAEENQSLLAQGLQKYQKNAFGEAEQLWNKALQQSPTEPALLFNQALCQIQQKKWDFALAYLRELQLLSPRYPELQKAFSYIETATHSHADPADEGLLQLFDTLVGKHFLLAEGLLIHWILSLLLLFVLGGLFRRRRKAGFKDLPIPPWQPFHWTLCALWIFASAVLLLKVISHADQQGTVVGQSVILLHSAPLAEAAELGDLPLGALVVVKGYYKDWVQVKWSDKPMGWVLGKNVLLLTPEGLR